jgi:hypothetical protein
MIGVISWFVRTAKAKGKSGALWGLIGAVSYYGPVLVFGLGIYPELIRGSVTYDNQLSYTIIGVLLDVAVGIGCCLVARQILLSKDGGNAPIAPPELHQEEHEVALERDANGSFVLAPSEFPQDKYEGPRCGGCDEPIEPEAKICPKCGRTQP